MSVCFHRLAAPGQLVLFAMGGTAYLALEIAWRGTTHWTMFLAGGACLCALDALGRLPLPTPLLAGIGAVGVSALELGTGLACRRLLHVEVWDYSQEWGNLAGLVCPKYTALWFLLCLWVLGMMRFCAVLPPMWPAQRLKVHFITLLFRPQGLKVRFITLAVCYNKTIAKQKGRGSHDSTIPVCSRPH